MPDKSRSHVSVLRPGGAYWFRPQQRKLIGIEKLMLQGFDVASLNLEANSDKDQLT